jgi:predicted RNase H-like HicB family nuclease
MSGKGRRPLETAATALQRWLAGIRRAFMRFENERTDERSTWTLTFRIWEDPLDGGWVAECPDLPGCLSQGETREEALYNLSDAIAGIISVRMEQQLSASSRDPDGAEVLTVAVAS